MQTGATKAETAVHFLRRAVEPPHSHVEAMAELSHRILVCSLESFCISSVPWLIHCMCVCIQSGLGAARDPDSAFQYATEAAQRSCPTGVSALARCHAGGVGTSIDIERAQQLFEVAAEMGDTRWAAYGLACLLREHFSKDEVCHVDLFSYEYSFFHWSMMSAQKPEEAIVRLRRIYDLFSSAANAQPPLVVAACEVTFN
jgi:TPR repeat protein